MQAWNTAVVFEGRFQKRLASLWSSFDCMDFEGRHDVPFQGVLSVDVADLDVFE
jgi:hypothetical protein